MNRYDAVVIGSGQAGNPLSQKLADHGNERVGVVSSQFRLSDCEHFFKQWNRIGEFIHRKVNAGQVESYIGCVRMRKHRDR